MWGAPVEPGPRPREPRTAGAGSAGPLSGSWTLAAGGALRGATYPPTVWGHLRAPTFPQWGVFHCGAELPAVVSESHPHPSLFQVSIW